MVKLWTETLISLIRVQGTTTFSLRREICRRSWFSTRASLPVLTLYTKHVCPLCDEAKAVLESYKHRFHFKEVDITAEGNEIWFKKYRYEIPVFHLNGTFLMKHRVDEDILEEELKKYEG